MSTADDVLKLAPLVGPLTEVGMEIFKAIQAASQGDMAAMKEAHDRAMAANARAVLALAKAELPT